MIDISKVPAVLDEILQERRNQEKKWGQQNWRCDLYYTILGEEVGEVGKAICEWIILKKGSVLDIRGELVQVAAVAVAMIECLDRNKT